MSKPTFYQRDDRLLMATGESPKGFAGTLAVVWEGTPDKLTETVKPVDELQTYRQLDPAHVPLLWWNAFADASGKIKRREPPPPEPPPEPKRQPRRQTPNAPRQVQRIEVPIVNMLVVYSIWGWGFLIALILAAVLKAVGLFQQ